MPITVHIRNKRDPRSRLDIRCGNSEPVPQNVHTLIEDISSLIGRERARLRFQADFPTNT